MSNKKQKVISDGGYMSVDPVEAVKANWDQIQKLTLPGSNKPAEEKKSMILEIKYNVNPVNIFALDPEPVFPDKDARLVFIDGQRVPKGLADIILLGLDVAQERYIDLIEKSMAEDLLTGYMGF